MNKILPKISCSRDEDGNPCIEIFGDPDSRVILSLEPVDGGWASAVKGEEGGCGPLPEPLRQGLLKAFLRWEQDQVKKG